MRSIQEWQRYLRQQQKNEAQPDKRQHPQRPAPRSASPEPPTRHVPPPKVRVPHNARDVSKGGPPPVPVQVTSPEGEVRPIGGKREAAQPKPPAAPLEPPQPKGRKTKAEGSAAAVEVVSRATSLSAERDRLRHLLSATREALQTQLPLEGMPARTAAQRRHREELEHKREALLARIYNPELTLQEVALLLRVSPTTVRRYANRGLLKAHRTEGNQRRFWLQDLLGFLTKARTA
jgi:excisionase family DNA binding protein